MQPLGLRPDERHQPYHQADEQRDGEAEHQHGPVQLDLISSRERSAVERHEHVGPADRRNDTRAAPRQGEDQALAQEVGDESSPARAQREAHRELSLPHFGPHQHEVRDVDARDEEYQQDRSPQQVERLPVHSQSPGIDGVGNRLRRPTEPRHCG